MRSGREITSSSESTCGLSRREFLGTCTACAAGLAAVSALGTAPAAAQSMPECPKAKVRLVFSHIAPAQPTWPNIGYDYEGRKKEVTRKLQQACPDIEFLPATAHNVAEAQKILESDKEVDGYLCHMTGIWTNVPQTIAATGRPTIFADDLYGGSGEFLVAYAAARRNGWKVAGVSSNDFDDVAQAAKCFSCMNKLRHSNILRIGTGFGCSPEGVENVFGTKTIFREHGDLNEYYEKADKAEARKWAEQWMSQAEKVVEPTRDEIVKSGAMYLGMRQMMNEHKAQAITINCLGGFYGGKITAYPCLGFFQLNNDGYVGACESDLKSTITMLLMGYLTGRPGYISDPVIDTAKNHIVYAHCVAMTKPFGPDGASNPYRIRSHSEDRKGAALQSLLPEGFMTTTLEINPVSRQVLFHQAKSDGNNPSDLACRTKLEAVVKGDLEKLTEEWRMGWHRVTFYGDIEGPVKELCARLKLELIEEA